MPEGLINLIVKVAGSWQVVLVTIVFFLYWSIVSAAVNPPAKVKKPVKAKKIKRPKEETVLDKNADTGDLGLGD